MATKRRSLIAIGVFVLIAIAVAAGRWYQMQHAAPQSSGAKAVIVHVTSGDDRGPGTLREALFVVAAATGVSAAEASFGRSLDRRRSGRAAPGHSRETIADTSLYGAP